MEVSAAQSRLTLELGHRLLSQTRRLRIQRVHRIQRQL